MTNLFGLFTITPAPAATASYFVLPLEKISIPFTILSGDKKPFKVALGSMGQDLSIRGSLHYEPDRGDVINWSTKQHYFISIRKTDITDIIIQDIALKSSNDPAYTFNVLPNNYAMHFLNHTNQVAKLNLTFAMP